MRMQTKIPARKVAASTLGAAVVTVLVYFYQDLTGQPNPLPANVVAALQVMVVFLAGYLVPPSPRDMIVSKDGR